MDDIDNLAAPDELVFTTSGSPVMLQVPRGIDGQLPELVKWGPRYFLRRRDGEGKERYDVVSCYSAAYWI